jgi:hypothetical protein
MTDAKALRDKENLIAAMQRDLLAKMEAKPCRMN